MSINLISSNKVRNLLQILAEIISYINPFTGSTSSANGKSGLVPAPQIADRTKFLRGDGTWQTVSGGSSGGISQQDVEDMLQDYLPLTGGNITNSLTIQTKDISVIEASGTNYIRYTNGIQVCWGSVNVTTSNPTTTFPMAFNDIPSLTMTVHGTNFTRATSVQAPSLTATNFSASIYSNSHTSGTASYIAWGFWK